MRTAISSFALAAFLTGCLGGAAVPNVSQGDAIGNSFGVVAATVPVVGGCTIFPTPPPSGPSGNDWWNTDISNYPVDPNAGNYIKEMGASTTLHPDFGQNPTY